MDSAHVSSCLNEPSGAEEIEIKAVLSVCACIGAVTRRNFSRNCHLPVAQAAHCYDSRLQALTS